MQTDSGLAVILKITPFKDYDAILELFTQKKGIISVMANGIRKHTSKNKGHCRFGSIVEYEYFPSKKNASIGKLKKITVQTACLSEDIYEQTRLVMLCEISSQFLSNEHQQEPIFILWQELLSVFPLSENRMIGFICRFFTLEGIFPPFKPENIIEGNNDFYWDNEYGITQSSSVSLSQKKISFPLIKTFHFASTAKLESMDSIDFSETDLYQFWDVFWWFYKHHCDYFPRAKKIYEEL